MLSIAVQYREVSVKKVEILKKLLRNLAIGRFLRQKNEKNL